MYFNATKSTQILLINTLVCFTLHFGLTNGSQVLEVLNAIDVLLIAHAFFDESSGLVPFSWLFPGTLYPKVNGYML